MKGLRRLLDQLVTLLCKLRILEPVQTPSQGKAAPAKPQNVFATGTFEHVTLYDLMVLLCHGKKSGKVEIHIGSHKALILVLEGEITSALYQDSIGEDAMMRIFADTDDNENAEFFIEPVNPLRPPGLPKTIQGSMDQLLFKIAMMLDDKRQQTVIAA